MPWLPAWPSRRTPLSSTHDRLHGTCSKTSPGLPSCHWNRPWSRNSGPTVVPLVNPDLQYLAYDSNLFQKVLDYPNAGLAEPGFAMIMVYRPVTAQAYGYGHLKF